MRHGPRKSVEVASEAIRLRQAGYKWTEIAKKLRVTLKLLEHWTAKQGLRPDRSKMKGSPANLARARELRAAGVPWKLVEREIGVCFHTLRKAILVEDRKMRDGQQ